MASDVPGLDVEVSFGDAERPLPNWREYIDPDKDPEDDSLTPEEEAAVIGMLGFDPADFIEDEEDEGSE